MSFDSRLGYRRICNIQKVLPAVYDDSLSYYEVLSKIQSKLQEMTEFYNQLADYQNVQDEALRNAYDELLEYVNTNVSELRQLVEVLTSSSLDWDVQHGILTTSQDAMRDMFNDVTVHSITVEQLNELDMTVAELSECGLNVRGLAVMSYWLMSEFQLLPEYQPPVQNRRFNVEDLLSSSVDQRGFIYVEV